MGVFVLADPLEVLVRPPANIVAEAIEEVRTLEPRLAVPVEDAPVEVDLQPPQRGRLVEVVHVRDARALVMWAFATPGTAINAPPASSAAEPARNFLREVAACAIPPLSRCIPSPLFVAPLPR